MFNIGAIGSGGGAGRLSAPSTIMPPPAYVPLADGIAADVYMDFVLGNYWNASPGSWNFSRASVAWGDNQAGVWSQFAANVPVITNKGLIVNPAATNLALWSRDLTNAAWVATNMAAQHNQVGIDNAANSATLLTASAANATVLQAISNPSATTITSFFLKRVTGSGVVNITLNGGTAWVPVTLTTSWQRFFINTAAVVNPSIGIQIIAANDAVACDFAQCEVATPTSGLPTTPILTMGAQATRAADAPIIPCGPVGSTITLLGIGTPIGAQTGSEVMASFTDGTNNNRFLIERVTTNSRGAVVIGGTITNITMSSAWTDVFGKIAMGGSAGSYAVCFNAGTVVTNTLAGYPPGMNQIALGGNAAIATSYWYINKIAAWLNHQATSAALQALTAAGGMVSTGITIAGQPANVPINFPNSSDANALVGAIAVTSSTGQPYAGTISISGGANAAQFALSNAGTYPCNLLVGSSNIGAGNYAIQLTATP